MRLCSLCTLACALAMYPDLAAGKEQSYALVMLAKPGLNEPLITAVQAGLVRVTSLSPGLSVKMPDAVNQAIGGDARHAMVECRAQFGCIGEIATHAGTDALMVARVSGSTIVTEGLVIQFLIIGKNGRGIERKCSFEIADASDVDVALRASFLPLFGMPLHSAAAGSAGAALTYVKKPMAKGDAALTPALERISDRVEDLELTLAAFDANEGANDDNLAVLDGLVTAAQALLAQLEGVIVQMDASAAPKWLRPRPQTTASDSP